MEQFRGEIGHRRRRGRGLLHRVGQGDGPARSRTAGARSASAIEAEGRSIAYMSDHQAPLDRAGHPRGRARAVPGRGPADPRRAVHRRRVLGQGRLGPFDRRLRRARGRRGRGQAPAALAPRPVAHRPGARPHPRRGPPAPGGQGRRGHLVARTRPSRSISARPRTRTCRASTRPGSARCSATSPPGSPSSPRSRRACPVGFTCQSFAALSLDPPMVILAPARSSTSWPRIAKAGAFCVNILERAPGGALPVLRRLGRRQVRGRRLVARHHRRARDRRARSPWSSAGWATSSTAATTSW